MRMYTHPWGGAVIQPQDVFFTHLLIWAGPLLLLVLVWSIFWKGLALWHSAQRGQPWWFVVMLVVNTLGILEIIYLFGVLKLHFEGLFAAHHHRE